MQNVQLASVPTPYRVAAPALPLGLALLLLWLVVLPYRAESRVSEEEPLRPVSTPDVGMLERLFAGNGYAWPPVDTVPPLFVGRIPGELGTLDTARKKALFFRALLPVVIAENDRIRAQRRALVALFERVHIAPGGDEWQRLSEVGRRYQVSGDFNDPKVRELLLRRVDVVPAGLVLAQAANESAWGTSRFAQEGNNLFGQWTWRKEAGLVPRQREEGARHYVRAFPDIRASVRAYLNNINAGHAYTDLRLQRAAMRAEGRPLDALELAGGLVRYSQRGEAYVEEIRAMIRGNGLNRLGPLQLAESATAD